jgi:hypothetical protein
MNDSEKRIKWDKTIRKYKIKERINSEVYLLQYICKSLVSERDVADKRYNFYANGIYYDFSSSVKDDLIPVEENVIRITNHALLVKFMKKIIILILYLLHKLIQNINYQMQSLVYNCQINIKIGMIL